MGKRFREEAASTSVPKESSKRPKPTAASTSAPTASVPVQAAEQNFPRGGGSGLDAVEYKKIVLEGRNEADKDVLFKSSVSAQDPESTKVKSKTKKSRSFKEKEKKQKASAIAQVEQTRQGNEATRIEHLNYKRLTPGTNLIAQIVSIEPLELLVSLPGQLFGYIPITSISPGLTALLESFEADDGETEVDLPALDEMFSVGQWLAVSVAVVHLSGGKKQIQKQRTSNEFIALSRKVELTIDPAVLNEPLSKDDMVKGFVLNAAVKSVEDHGYIFDFGVEGITGFLSFKQALKLTETKMHVGQVILATIGSVASTGRTCNILLDSPQLVVSSVTDISMVLPAFLVKALITIATPSGLNVRFLGFYDGTIDTYHLDPSQEYKAGDEISARIIWDSPTSDPKKFSLSCLPHILAMGANNIQRSEKFPIGTPMTDIAISRVEPERGVMAKIKSEDMRAYIHISQISDEHQSTLSSAIGPCKVGSSHSGRVVGYAAVDDMLQMSFKQSVMERRLLTVDDAQVGEVVQGTVKFVSPGKLFVDIGGSVDAVVWPLHFADVQIKQVEKKFKVGAKVSGRILSVDSQLNRVSLTLKKTLVNTELPLLLDWDTKAIATTTHGVVSLLKDNGMLVEFYGGIKAFVPLSELSETFTAKSSDHFNLGQIVMVKILSVDEANRRIIASIKQAKLITSPAEASTSKLPALEIGNVVSGNLTAIQKPNAVISLIPSGARALCSLVNLAHARSTTLSDLQTSIKIGELINDLVVISCNSEKQIVIVSNKPKAAVTKAIDINTVEVGTCLTGRVLRRTARGLDVSINKSTRGRIHLTDLSDDYDAINITDDLNTSKNASTPGEGTTLKCAVVKINKSTKFLDFSLRRSRIDPDNETIIKDKEILSTKDLAVGSSIRGFVKNISPAGVFVELGRGIDGRVQIKEMFNEFVKDWKSRFEVGQLISARILKIYGTQIELSMKDPKENKIKPASPAVVYTEGQKVKAVVKTLESYGIFLEINGTKISGLCHKSEISDEADADLKSAIENFAPGDCVLAKILKLDGKGRPQAFGIKPSYFDDEDFQKDQIKFPLSSAAGAGGSSSNETEDEDEERIVGSDIDSSNDEESNSNLSSDDADDDEMEDSTGGVVSVSHDEQSEPNEKAMPIAAKLKIKSGFQWDGEASDGSDSEDSDLEIEREEGVKTASNRKRGTEKKNKLIAEDLTGSLANNDNSSSTQDLERMLLSSPNSSQIWIQYMSLMLNLADVDQARVIGHRALKSIGHREDHERLNIWIALLNLENAYGSESTFEEEFKKAILSCDGKTVHRLMADLLEKCNKVERAEDIFKRMTKKFGTSSKVWTLYGEFLFRQHRFNEARELLNRSLKSLVKRKHIKTIAKFGQMEFRYGDAERGKSIFEGIVESYPKRLDMWFVYVDMLLKSSDDNITLARNVFTKVLQTRLSVKKAKSVFKKWLEVEKGRIDGGQADLVKRTAAEWVAKKQSADVEMQ